MKTTFSDVLGSINNVQKVVDEKEDMPGGYRLFSHTVILVLLLSSSLVYELVLLEVAVFSVAVHILSDLFADCFMW